MEEKFAVKQTPRCFNDVGTYMALEQTGHKKVLQVSSEALGRSSTWLSRWEI